MGTKCGPGMHDWNLCQRGWGVGFPTRFLGSWFVSRKFLPSCSSQPPNALADTLPGLQKVISGCALEYSRLFIQGVHADDAASPQTKNLVLSMALGTGTLPFCIGPHSSGWSLTRSYFCCRDACGSGNSWDSTMVRSLHFEGPVTYF